MWGWPILITASAIGTGLSVVGNLELPLRFTLVLWFLLVCPGMAFVKLMCLQDFIKEIALAMALSLGLDFALATLMLYTRLWYPEFGLIILIGLCLIGVILQIVNFYRPTKRSVDITYENKAKELV